MMQGPDGYQPVAGWMGDNWLPRIQEWNAPNNPANQMGLRIHYDILEYNPLLDSANMEMHHWVRIAGYH